MPRLSFYEHTDRQKRVQLIRNWQLSNLRLIEEYRPYFPETPLTSSSSAELYEHLKRAGAQIREYKQRKNISTPPKQ